MININIDEINNSIGRLRSLQTRCDLVSTTPPVTVGGGKTVNKLEEIASMYESLNECFGELVSNTILFLQNTRDSYVSSDSKAADKIVNG